MPGPGVGALAAVASRRGRRFITRTLLWVSPLFLLAPLLVGMLLIEPPKNNCAPATIVEPDNSLTADQRANATAIIEAGRKLKVPDFGITVALAVALQESNLAVLDHGDTAGPDSRGLFQQRTGWGSEAERMDPEQSATLFYKALLSVPGWDSMPLTDIAAQVQKPRADLRDEYAKHEGTARLLLAENGGDTQLVSRSTTPNDPISGGTPKVDPNAWKLTLPIGDAEEKRGSELTSFVHPVLYHPGRGGGWVFNAPAGGASTNGSSYPRTELRELSDGKEAAWTNSKGVHEMTIQQAINADASGKGVVAGQIHDDEDDVLRVVLKGPRLFASFSAGKGKDLPYQTIDDNYRLGTPFTLRLVADPSGVHVFYNGQEKASLKRTFDGAYFKAGAYTQSTDSGDGAGEVVIYGLSVMHDGKGSASQFGTPIPGQQTCTCTLPPTGGDAPGTVHLSDKRIEQSSGLTMSHKNSGLAYTINDDPGPVFAIDTRSGKVVGTTDVGGTDDTEALTADNNGRLWLANLGNNHGNKAGLSIVVFDEPGTTSGEAKNVHRYRVAYPGDAPNVEALVVADDGEVSLFTKESGKGRRYALPATLSENGVNVAQPASGEFPAMVTDAATSRGKAYLRHAGGVAIYDTTTWTRTGSLEVPKVDKGETITVDGATLLEGSEGTNSPLIRVPLTGATNDSGQPTETELAGPAPTECTAGDDLQLTSINIGKMPVLSALDANNFGKTGARWKTGHTGNDYGAPCGTPVYAVNDGTVHIRTGNDRFGKWLVTVSTGEGTLATDYAHMQAVDVEDGQPIKAGEKLGSVGDLGNSEGCHLHLEVHVKGGAGGTMDDAIDPHQWLSSNGGQLIRTSQEVVLDDKHD